MYAPIALFTFKRPIHTRTALTSLLANPEIYMSPLYIYCDGARNRAEHADVVASRATVRSLAPVHAVIIERENNLGVDISIVTEVAELCRRYGRVIVVEDDLEVSASFLAYMNTALDRYEFSEQVMQISGYMFPVKFLTAYTAVFLPYMTSWGWGTWSRALKHFDGVVQCYAELSNSPSRRKKFDLDGAYPYFRILRKNMKKTVPAWDILFYLNIFNSNSVVLHPVESLVRNNGFDGSGTTCGKYYMKESSLGTSAEIILPEFLSVDSMAYAAVKKYLRKQSSIYMKIISKIMAYL